MGCYVGACGSEVHGHWLSDIPTITGTCSTEVFDNVGASGFPCMCHVGPQRCSPRMALGAGYEQTGCAQSMFANRLSWWFDFRGPSKCIDTGEPCVHSQPPCGSSLWQTPWVPWTATGQLSSWHMCQHENVRCPGAACSSSLMAFNDAMADLAAGRTDYALVGGASNILRAHTSIAFQRLHMLSPEARRHLACSSGLLIRLIRCSRRHPARMLCKQMHCRVLGRAALLAPQVPGKLGAHTLSSMHGSGGHGKCVSSEAMRMQGPGKLG